jgi:hypothetical protein
MDSLPEGENEVGDIRARGWDSKQNKADGCRHIERSIVGGLAIS